MDKVISRRDFIVGGGVFGASMAAVGLAGCAPSNGGLPSTDTDASGTSTHKGADRPLSSRLVEVDEGDVVRTEECDVVVCGSGSAGTYAAIRAAELGARVIWLEKTSLKGGTSTITEGTLAYNTQEQLDAQGAHRLADRVRNLHAVAQLGCLCTRDLVLPGQFWRSPRLGHKPWGFDVNWWPGCPSELL